jgi:hypothetical protein
VNRLPAVLAVGVLLGAVSWDGSRALEAQTEPSLDVHALAVPNAPLAVRVVRPPAPGLGASLAYAAENRTRASISAFTSTAFVFRADGQPRGFQTQPARQGLRRLSAGASGTFVLAFDRIAPEPGDVVVLAPSRAVSLMGEWHADRSALARMARKLVLGISADTSPDMVPRPVVALPWSAAPRQENWGPMWCQEERRACLDMCGGTKCVRSFACNAKECSSECVCSC